MNTPIYDFVTAYARSDTRRLHMPGHKGQPFVGCEGLDITEISGADALYGASGIIAQSEENAGRLFGTGKTLYSTEGSSQCIRAMVYLALTCRKKGSAPVILAGRNAHKAFLYACALGDVTPHWIYPRENSGLCACPVTPEILREALREEKVTPAAVYVTSPDYLGGMQDIAALARVCHEFGTLLLVDNAHGAYLHFLQPSRHPMDLGADLCCDSAHKTLPVLTGGAYLHLAKGLPEQFYRMGKSAMALFGSTSPSYLTLMSLDRCNGYLASGYGEKLFSRIRELEELKKRLKAKGWEIVPSDPLRLTIQTQGRALSEILRRRGLECEFADPDYLVCMVTPENPQEDLQRLEAALPPPIRREKPELPCLRLETVCSPREALFAPQVEIPVEEGVGRVCGSPGISCPPAVPVAVSGERITREAVERMKYYEINSLWVLQ